MDDATPSAADVVETWRETSRAAELTDRLSREALETTTYAAEQAVAAEDVARLAEEAAMAADRAAARAHNAAKKARQLATDSRRHADARQNTSGPAVD